jgi:acetylornithine deacetylase/succinyl-diaminopimelate desuccinylase-like protein
MTRRVATLAVLAAALAPCAAHARPRAIADAAVIRAQVQRWREANEAAIVRELADLVALPNVMADQPNVRRNAEALVAALKRRGLEARLLEEPDASPIVYAELKGPRAERTVVIYAHYDGQPADPAQWAGSPWTPILRDAPLDQGGKEIPLPQPGQRVSPEARLYGRSSGDDKGPIVAMLAALDAMRASNIRPSVNIKFFFEGEEEKDSPHLRAYLEHHRELLGSDPWIICDGPAHQSRRFMVVHGARGIVGLELTVYGASRALHDGHYGNWAPNPAALLASLVASMRDPEGRVLVAGFYDGVRPLSEAEEQARAEVPSMDADLRREFALARTEAGDAPIAERILVPGMNVRGLLAGKVGAQATNAIPTEAKASIDLRLVPDQKLEAAKEAIEAHLRGQGYHVVRADPDADARRAHPRIVRVDWTGGYPAYRTPMDVPFARAVSSVVTEAVAAPIVRLPNMGGSVPLYLMHDILEASVVLLPTANYDDNQHAPNENMRIGNLWDGIQIFADLFARMDAVWPKESPRTAR